MVSEIDEVLDGINWKIHRRDRKTVSIDNLALEFADLFKYVMSLFELWGICTDEVLEYVKQKSDAIKIMYEMEYKPSPMNSKILICDLDGTIADWQTSFRKWLVTTGKIDEDSFSPFRSLNQDVDMGVSYDVYEKWKLEFEETGGYRSLVPILDGMITVKRLKDSGVFLAVHTARPQARIKRIWMDTYYWLSSYGIEPDLLEIGSESRIVKALELKKNNSVIMFEDNPELSVRAANSDIVVYMRDTEYNQGITHENIVRVSRFNAEYDYFKER
jgi:uncharacterized HAD superfamily protein